MFIADDGPQQYGNGERRPQLGLTTPINAPEAPIPPHALDLSNRLAQV